MAHAPIDPQAALSRHPDEAAQLMQQLGIKDPAAAKWAYSMAMRIDGSQRAQVDKGINVFLRNPDPYYLGLEAAVGRKKKELTLDKAKLVAGPREHLPVEMFEHVRRPKGVSAFIWQPNRAESPGWNELVITGGVRLGDQRLLRGTLDTGAEKLLHVHGEQWRQVQQHRAAEVFGKPLAPKVRAWLNKNTPFPATAGVEALSVSDIEQLLATKPGRKLSSRESSAADILEELGFGSEEAAAIAPANSPSDTPDLPTQGGRLYRWGEQVSDTDIAGYARLMAAQSGPSSGNALEVLMGVANPVNQALRTLSGLVLNRLASGDAPDAAMFAALSRLATQQGLPAPTSSADPVAYLHQHLHGATPAPLHPVLLPTHPRR